MAADAIGEIADSLFLMFAGDLRLGVFVAAVTGISREAVGMADAARTYHSAVTDGKGMGAAELRRHPSGSRMTGGAIHPEQAGMIGRFSVTGGALHRRACENAVGMALLTIQAGVRAGEWEGR